MRARVGVATLAVVLLGAGALAAERAQPIERIYVPHEDVLAVLDLPFQRILESVLPQYNSEAGRKQNPIRIAGGVVLGEDLDAPTANFTLTVDQDAQRTQTMVIEIDGLGMAELKLDPVTGEASFHVTYRDGRRSIAGRGALG